MKDAGDGHVVSVEIQGHRYPIHSSLDQEYIVRLAHFVDARMRTIGEGAPNADVLRLAVLTALNIADELFRCREEHHSTDGNLAERAGRIEQMIDRLLAV